MKLLRGVSEGAVLQRGENGCDVLFSALHRGPVRVSEGEAAPLGGGWFRLTGVPVGGPRRLTFRDDEGEESVDGVCVGDVWILAGQSNMEGAGLRRKKEEEYDAAPRSDVRAYYLDDRWDAARSRLHQQWLNSDCGVREKYYRDGARFLSFYGAFTVDKASGVGPGHFIGVRMAELTGVPQGLIPCAYGGASLSDWAPGNRTPASLFRSMMRRVGDCGGRVRGAFWYQGEAETSPEGNERFNERMKELIGELRVETRDAALPFVEAQIGPCSLPQAANPDSCRYWHGIKELQRKLPEWLPHTSTVPTTGAGLQDMIHLDAASQEELGIRMAEEMHRLITGQGTGVPALSRVEIFPHPVKRGFSVAALTFRNLIGALTCAGRPHGFSVTVDDQTPWEYPYRYLSEIRLEGDRVLVTVEDDYVPPDRAYLWYGAGCGTVCTVTDGAGRSLPAFGPVKIR